MITLQHVKYTKCTFLEQKLQVGFYVKLLLSESLCVAFRKFVKTHTNRALAVKQKKREKYIFTVTFFTNFS